MIRCPFTIMFLLFTACSSGQEQGEQAHALDQEIERLTSGRTLWPGFDPLSIPLAVYDGHQTYLFRHPSPPEGFAVDEKLGNGAYVYEGRYPEVSANSSANIGDTPTATILLDPDDVGSPLANLAAVALHESFHVFQRENHPSWQGNEMDLFTYPTDDAELLALRRLETQALHRALATSDESDGLCWAIRALELRLERYAGMDEVFIAYERASELNEGLATYIELRALGLETVTFPEGGFGATQVRDRVYDTGGAIALLLDQASPGWQDSFESDDSQNLDEALASALGVDIDQPTEKCVFSNNEIANANRYAREDVAGVIASRSERRTAFESAPGWRVEVIAADGEPLWPAGFDPLNIERVDGGVVHTRLLSLGNESCQMEMLDADGADLEGLTEGAGSHPIFNGIRRVVISGLDQPRVDRDGNQISLEAPGYSASFQRARLQENPGELMIELSPTRN